MAEPERTAGRHDNPAVEHEHSDVNVRAILWFLAALVIGGVIVHVGLWWMKEALVQREREASPPLPPLAKRERLQLPRDVGKIPEPQLEAFERQALKELREKEARLTTTYGWVDKDAGVVRIPVERALELTLAEGLPARTKKAGEDARR